LEDLDARPLGNRDTGVISLTAASPMAVIGLAAVFLVVPWLYAESSDTEPRGSVTIGALVAPVEGLTDGRATTHPDHPHRVADRQHVSIRSRSLLIFRLDIVTDPDLA